MNVTFSGFYGMKNTGDDCFCKVAEWGAQHYWGADTSYFFSKKIPKLSSNAKPIMKTLPYRLQFINELLLDRHFKKNKHLVYSGGSIFHGKDWWEMEYANKNFEKYDLKIGAIGVSVGPFDSVAHEKKVIEFMKRMSFLCVRDLKSYELVQSYNLDLPCTHAFDLAGLLPKVDKLDLKAKQESTKSTIGLALCSFSGKTGKVRHENSERLQILASAINTLNAKRGGDVTLRLFVFNGHELHGDMAATQKFIRLLDPSVSVELFDYVTDPMSMWHQIGECDAFLSFRLHGAIYAFMAHVPFLLAEVHEKASNFLKDIDWPEKFRVGDFEVSPDSLVGIVEKMLEGHDFSQSIKRCENDAEKNFTHAVFD